MTANRNKRPKSGKGSLSTNEEAILAVVLGQRSTTRLLRLCERDKKDPPTLSYEAFGDYDRKMKLLNTPTGQILQDPDLLEAMHQAKSRVASERWRTKYTVEERKEHTSKATAARVKAAAAKRKKGKKK